jgi:hypothetical protein
MAPLAEPLLEGLNVTVNVLLWSGASVNGVEIPLTPTPAPLVLADVTEMLCPHVFLIVTNCEPICPIVTLPKAMLLGPATSCPPVAPVPARLTTCGFCGALSVNDTVPVRTPTAVGVNVTFTVQFAPATSVAPQLLDWAKSPVAATALKEILVLPAFVNVSD